MIHSLLDFLRTLTTPERLIEFLSTVVSGWLGYAMLTAIVFAETGLLVGFFLPGDSLLFTVGVVIGAGQLNLALILGYLLGGVGIVRRNFEKFVLLIIFVSLLPIFIQVLKAKFQKNTAD